MDIPLSLKWSTGGAVVVKRIFFFGEPLRKLVLLTVRMISVIAFEVSSVVQLTSWLKGCWEGNTGLEGVKAEIVDLKYASENGRGSWKGTGLWSYAYLFTTSRWTDFTNHDFSEHEELCGDAKVSKFSNELMLVVELIRITEGEVVEGCVPGMRHEMQ